MTNPTVENILRDWLKQHGYDGLCDLDAECGCSLDNFIPCGEVQMDCEAGYKGPVGERGEFFIGQEKPGKAKEMTKFKVGEEVIAKIRTRVTEVQEDNRYSICIGTTVVTLSGDALEKASE